MDTLFRIGVRLKLSKCSFRLILAAFLGHIVDKDGLRPSDEHLETIRKLVEQEYGKKLMRFLGLVNFFASLMDQFVDDAVPLNKGWQCGCFTEKKRRGERLLIPDWNTRWGRLNRRLKGS